jgi:hypothetical protein
VGVVVVGVVVVVVVAQEVFCISPDLRMSELRKLGSVCIYIFHNFYANFYSICQKSQVICSVINRASEWIGHEVIW